MTDTRLVRSVDEPHTHEPPADVDERARWIRHSRAVLALTVQRPVTPGQLTSLGIELSKLGLSRDAALGYCSAVVGRVITSRRQLSSREASAILDVIEGKSVDEP